MSSPQVRSGWWKMAALESPQFMALPATLLLALLAAAPHARAQDTNTDAGWRDVSVAEYRQHLHDLDALVAACQAQWAAHATQQKIQEACDAGRVGPNDRVLWPGGAESGRREVRYDWLRAALDRAAGKNAAAQPTMAGPAAGAKSSATATGELLTEARQRLQQDANQASNPAEANPDYAGERKALNTILAQKAYRGVSAVSPRERFVEWFYQQLDKFLAGLMRLGARAPWIVFVLRALLLACICVALIWFLLRLERGARVHLIPDVEPAPGAPAAREWQLWLKDAHAMADDGHWREAIHFVYWAAIARLEQRRLWPADRARTPREYLALVPEADKRKQALTALTRSFERTWYGGREAAPSDFNAALEQASSLGVRAE